VPQFGLCSFGPSPASQKLVWTGEVVPQKWTNFYMKMLTHLVSAGDLKLSVDVQATPKDGVTDQQVEEVKAALRGLRVCYFIA